MPDEKEWAALSPAGRAAVEQRIYDALNDEKQRNIEEAERQREEAERRLRQSQCQVAERVLLRLGARGIATSDEQRQAIVSCEDMTVLLNWLEQAQTVPSAEELLRLDPA